MRYTCPVCLFAELPYPPKDYHICPCCSTEFGNDDVDFSHEQLRGMWIASGASWFFSKPPANWNPWVQLIAGGYWYAVPQLERNLITHADSRTKRIRLVNEPIPEPVAG